MSQYDFYLGGVQLPVAPGELKISIANQNSTYVLVDQGEINLLKRAGLTEIEFECLLPQARYPFAVYAGGFKPAVYYLAHLEQLKVSRKPFQFIVSRAMPDGRVLFSNNIKVSLEDYSIIENAKSGFDVQVKIRLKQYKDFGTRTMAVTETEAGLVLAVQAARAAENAPEPDELRRAVWRQ